ncbi:MAG: hypothetical protein ACE5I0_10540 [Candidatus Binatia bacterium]
MEHSIEIYLQVLQFIGENPEFSNHKNLIAAVKDRIRALEKDLAAINQEAVPTELSPEAQSLIKELFSFSQTKEAAKMQGALALAEFGQYERALQEFHALLNEGSMPVVAAKNILRCHLALYSPDDAIAQFREWVSGDLLSLPELKLIRNFLIDFLEEKDIRTQVPPLVEISSAKEDTGEEEEGFLDISCVIVELEKGPRKGDAVEFEVTFQSDNMIRAIIPANKQSLIDAFEPGLHLPEIQCYSPVAVFRGRGMVSAKTKITHGSNIGDYMLAITVDGA